jgi:hypothetical protein
MKSLLSRPHVTATRVPLSLDGVALVYALCLTYSYCENQVSSPKGRHDWTCVSSLKWDPLALTMGPKLRARAQGQGNSDMGSSFFGLPG